MVLKNLMAEVYFILKPPKQFGGKMHNAYLKKLKVLKNKFNTGRNWYLIQQRFPNNILALILINSKTFLKVT